MSPVPFAIHGLGRIGRALLRIAHRHPGLRPVAVADLAPSESLARLVARDSVHGRFDAEVRAEGNTLWLDDTPVTVLCGAQGQVPAWGNTGARIVVEATGKATERRKAAAHLEQGAEMVVVSALSPDADLTLCLGLNGDAVDPTRHQVISNASCTTNCLALLVKVLDEGFGIRQALMNEVHGYTGNQLLLDGVHPDPRRGRAAAMNLVPTTSGAPTAVANLVQGLEGRLQGLAVRAPTPAVALLDLVATLESPASTNELATAFRQAAQGPLTGLLAVSEEPLVSSDHVGDPHSAIVDLPLLQSFDGLCRVMAWYDNEWGYANRLADLLNLLGERLP